MKPRHVTRAEARVAVNAARLNLPVTEYLALPRRERRRRLAEERQATRPAVAEALNKAAERLDEILRGDG